MRMVGFATVLFAMSAVFAKGEKAPPLPVDPETGRFQYQEVVTVEGASADELYARAKNFVVDAYKSAKAVIDLDDPAAHRLVARGNFQIEWSLAVRTVNHKLSIEVKDGRYRYTLSEFVAEFPHGDMELEDKYLSTTKLAVRTGELCGSLIQGLKSAMSQAPKEW